MFLVIPSLSYNFLVIPSFSYNFLVIPSFSYNFLVIPSFSYNFLVIPSCLCSYTAHSSTSIKTLQISDLPNFVANIEMSRILPHFKTVQC